MTNTSNLNANASREAQEAMDFAAQYKDRPIIAAPQATHTAPRLMEHNIAGSEVKIVNGQTITRINEHKGWGKAVDPDAPLNFNGIEIAQSQVPGLIAAGVITQAQVDELRGNLLKGNALPFDEAPEGAEDGEAQDEGKTDVEEAQAFDAEGHNQAVEEVYQTNSGEAVDALINEYVTDGTLADNVNLPAETLDKLVAGFTANLDSKIAEYGVDAKLLTALLDDNAQAELRTAVIYNAEGTMKKIAMQARDSLFRPDVSAKLVSFAQAGGFQTQEQVNGPTLIEIPERGWMPLVDAITQRIIVL